jgi:hypothetical protein
MTATVHMATAEEALMGTFEEAFCRFFRGITTFQKFTNRIKVRNIAAQLCVIPYINRYFGRI